MKYNYSKAKEIINAEMGLESALLGMHEDWWWTSETIWQDGHFLCDLTDGDKIAGINGSNWATPTLCLRYKDGRERFIKCAQGESTGEKPVFFTLGVLSSPAQEAIPPLED